jgi:hypothetical protein
VIRFNRLPTLGIQKGHDVRNVLFVNFDAQVIEGLKQTEQGIDELFIGYYSRLSRKEVSHLSLQSVCKSDTRNYELPRHQNAKINARSPKISHADPLHFSATANGNSFGFPNAVHGENLHAPLCRLIYQ